MTLVSLILTVAYMSRSVSKPQKSSLISGLLQEPHHPLPFENLQGAGVMEGDVQVGPRRDPGERVESHSFPSTSVVDPQHDDHHYEIPGRPRHRPTILNLDDKQRTVEARKLKRHCPPANPEKV